MNSSLLNIRILVISVCFFKFVSFSLFINLRLSAFRTVSDPYLNFFLCLLEFGIFSFFISIWFILLSQLQIISTPVSAMGSQQPLLLFFDTFSHEIVEELNLDLVSWPISSIKTIFELYQNKLFGLVVRAEGSRPRGRGFESRRILDGCKRC